VVAKIAGIQHLLKVNHVGFGYGRGNPSKQNNLRMTGLRREAAGNGHGFVYGQIRK
jgi:hypothetical protein